MQTGKGTSQKRAASLAAAAFAAAAAALLLFLPASSFLARTYVLHRIGDSFGVTASAHAVEFHPSRGELEIYGLTLSNPKGYPGRELTRVRRLKAEFDARSLFSAQKRILDLQVDIATVTVVRNQFKVLNIQALPAGEEGIVIDRLRASIPEIDFIDYSAGDEPVVRRIPAGLNVEYEGVGGLGKAVYLISSEILRSAGIAEIGPLPGALPAPRLPEPAEEGRRSTWTFEDTARGTASAVLGGLRATTGRIGDLIAPRSGTPLQSRMTKPYSGADAAPPKSSAS